MAGQVANPEYCEWSDQIIALTEKLVVLDREVSRARVEDNLSLAAALRLKSRRLVLGLEALKSGRVMLDHG